MIDPDLRIDGHRLGLFQKVNGIPLYIDGDDDSGSRLNSKVTQRLFRGQEYVVRLRLYFATSAGSGAVMLY
jgi:hypothetical protein